MLGMSRNKILGLVVAALVALATWFLQGQGISVGNDGSAPREPSSPTATVTPSEAASPPSGTDPESGLRWISVDELPDEAHETLEMIDEGGPYPHPEDGTVFQNREGILPDQSRGYYLEYTVETPGLHHRGILRIVTGSSDEYYWTKDHYDSFERIAR